MIMMKKSDKQHTKPELQEWCHQRRRRSLLRQRTPVCKATTAVLSPRQRLQTNQPTVPPSHSADRTCIDSTHLWYWQYIPVWTVHTCGINSTYLYWQYTSVVLTVHTCMDSTHLWYWQDIPVWTVHTCGINSIYLYWQYTPVILTVHTCINSTYLY